MSSEAKSPVSGEGDARFQIKYRTLAASFGVLALGLGGALAAVVFWRNADVLAVVALVVSTVSFLIQIAIALAQLAQSNAQLAQAERLNIESLKTMTAIESGLGETQRAVQTQTSALLSLSLGKVAAVSLKRDLSEESDDSNLLQSVNGDSLLSWLTEASGSISPPTELSQGAHAQIISDTSRFLSKLEALDDGALDLFALAVIDDLQSARLGGAGGLPRSRGDEPLIAAGLARPLDVAGVELVTLTTEGTIAAAALTLPPSAFASDPTLLQRIISLRGRLDTQLRLGLENERDLA